MDTQDQFEHHVVAHLEQFALFAIPRGYTEVGDADFAKAAPGSKLAASSSHGVDALGSSSYAFVTRY